MRKFLFAAAAALLAACSEDCPETMRIAFDLDEDPGAAMDSVYLELALSSTYPTSDWERVGKMLDDSGRATFDVPVGKYLWYVLLAPGKDSTERTREVWLSIEARDEYGNTLQLERSTYKTHCDGIQFDH